MIIKSIFKKQSLKGLLHKCNIGNIVSRRQFATFNFIDDKKTAEETVYFKKQEEAILARMLEKDPSLDPRYSAPSHQLELFNDLSLALSKFGMTEPSLALMEELVLVFKNNGYKKTE